MVMGELNKSLVIIAVVVARSCSAVCRRMCNGELTSSTVKEKVNLSLCLTKHYAVTTSGLVDV
jgi:hypothetical protein